MNRAGVKNELVAVAPSHVPPKSNSEDIQNLPTTLPTSSQRSVNHTHLNSVINMARNPPRVQAFESLDERSAPPTFFR